MTKPIAVIIGATGGQGGSVVDTFLQDGTYQVRGVTRNVNSANAQALSKRGVEVVTADLNNEASLVEVFKVCEPRSSPNSTDKLKGASLIFAVTDFFEPFAAKGPVEAMKVESAQGINLAKAASATPTLKHYIWSTLPNGKKITGGKHVVPHFEAKNQIDAYIKSDAVLLAKTTFVWVTFFASNLFFPMFTPNLIVGSNHQNLKNPLKDVNRNPLVNTYGSSQLPRIHPSYLSQIKRRMLVPSFWELQRNQS